METNQVANSYDNKERGRRKKQTNLYNKEPNDEEKKIHVNMMQQGNMILWKDKQVKQK